MGFTVRFVIFISLSMALAFAAGSLLASMP
jgi:hypothetical protein